MSDTETEREVQKKMNILDFVLLGMIAVLIYIIVLDVKDIKRLRKQIKEMECVVSEKEKE